MTGFAAFDVGFDVLLDLGPPEFAEYEFLHLLDSWVAGSDVVMTPGDDLASQGGFSGDVHASVIVEESSLMGYSSFVREGGGDASIPELFLSGDFFNLSGDGVSGGHYESPEVFCLEDDDIVVVLLPLVVVLASGQEVGLFIEDAQFVS